jgi:REP-associated tyrosine transposase
MDWQNLDHGSHAVGQNCFHFTWTPKYRYPVFRFPNYVREMEQIMREVAQKHSIKIHQLCIEPDHLHCFASFPSTICVSKALGLLKGGSSFKFRRKHARLQTYRALWSKGKFYRSVGSVTTDAVNKYINDTHHSSRLPISQQRLT